MSQKIPFDQASKILEVWKTNESKIQGLSEHLQLIGMRPESPIIEAYWGLFDCHTELIAAILGVEDWTDQTHCKNDLDWYANECRMGRDPKTGVSTCGKVRKIETINDLLWLIGYKEVA